MKTTTRFIFQFSEHGLKWYSQDPQSTCSFTVVHLSTGVNRVLGAAVQGNYWQTGLSLAITTIVKYEMVH